MLVIVHANFSWPEDTKKLTRRREDVKEAMKSTAFVADWSYDLEGPFLEMEDYDGYTMDDFMADMEGLIDLGAFGDIVLADTCSDHPLIRVSITRGVISGVAFRKEDMNIAFKLARRVDLNEI